MITSCPQKVPLCEEIFGSLDQEAPFTFPFNPDVEGRLARIALFSSGHVRGSRLGFMRCEQAKARFQDRCGSPAESCCALTYRLTSDKDLRPAYVIKIAQEPDVP